MAPGLLTPDVPKFAGESTQPPSPSTVSEAIETTTEMLATTTATEQITTTSPTAAAMQVTSTAFEMIKETATTVLGAGLAELSKTPEPWIPGNATTTPYTPSFTDSADLSSTPRPYYPSSTTPNVITTMAPVVCPQPSAFSLFVSTVRSSFTIYQV